MKNKTKEQLFYSLMGLAIGGAILSIATGLIFSAPAPFIFSLGFCLTACVSLPLCTSLLLKK